MIKNINNLLILYIFILCLKMIQFGQLLDEN